MQLESALPKYKRFNSFIVFRSVGSSYLSKKLAVDIGLDNGGFFNVLVDKTNDKDYYLVKDNTGLKVNHQLKSVQFTARTLARDIGWKFGVDHKFIKVQVGPKIMQDGKELFPLITAGLKFEIK